MKLSKTQWQLVTWIVIAIVALLAWQRLNPFARRSSSAQPDYGSSFGGGGGGVGFVTAPNVSPTPTTTQQIVTSGSGNQPQRTVNLYTNPLTRGDRILGATVDGRQESPFTPELEAFTQFHANDANVISQVNREKSSVAPGQKVKYIGGYKQDGTPILYY